MLAVCDGLGASVGELHWPCTPFSVGSVSLSLMPAPEPVEGDMLVLTGKLVAPALTRVLSSTGPKEVPLLEIKELVIPVSVTGYELVATD